jgi:LuxR family maltose regulon positive regulatory protein
MTRMPDLEAGRPDCGTTRNATGFGAAGPVCGDPRAATVILTPVPDGAVPGPDPVWYVQVFLLECAASPHTPHVSPIPGILSRRSRGQHASVSEEPRRRLREQLSASELRVLRYLPTNLTMQEIADQLHVSVNTVKAHVRHLYTKLDAHNRGQAVQHARTLHLLAPAGITPIR